MKHLDVQAEHIKSQYFHISISREAYLAYYSGKIKQVVVTAQSGLRVKFPANLLTSYVTHQGVQGYFVLKYLTTGKVVSLDKISAR
jgi:hypothetical protein